MQRRECDVGGDLVVRGRRAAVVGVMEETRSVVCNDGEVDRVAVGLDAGMGQLP